MDKIFLGIIVVLLLIIYFKGNRYFKGLVALEIYKTNQVLVDKVVDKNAFKYMMSAFTELPEQELCKESIRLYYRDVYGHFAILYIFKKQGMLLPGEWEAIEGCLKGFMFQNKPTTEYGQMIADGKRLWPKDYRLYIKDILEKHKEKRDI